ncbi:MAG TPA: DinB family protein [Sphingobacteriaceae bacterium]|nr:DinB family protein [Sphingobacteriaceae bacterium]
MTSISDRILFLCNSIPAKLRPLSEDEFSYRPAPDKWSKKEILGHLIDSATNNHQRFIRGQYENSPVIFYDQTQWVQLQQFNTENKDTLITFWELYNRHLAHIISVTPIGNLSKTCTGKDGISYTLAF